MLNALKLIMYTKRSCEPSFVAFENLGPTASAVIQALAVLLTCSDCPEAVLYSAKGTPWLGAPETLLRSSGSWVLAAAAAAAGLLLASSTLWNDPTFELSALEASDMPHACGFPS